MESFQALETTVILLSIQTDGLKYNEIQVLGLKMLAGAIILYYVVNVTKAGVWEVTML